MSGNYDTTYQLAVQRMAERDVAEVSWKCGADYQPDAGSLDLVFLGRRYAISFPDCRISCGELSEIPLVEQVLLLHYLQYATGVPPAGRLIPFRELPGGNIYTSAFAQRVTQPFLKIFGTRPEAFAAAAGSLGGKRSTLGDVSFCIPAFPLVPVTMVLWLGDDEFAPSANVLFDASGPDFLPTEDFTVLSSLVVKELRQRAN